MTDLRLRRIGRVVPAIILFPLALVILMVCPLLSMLALVVFIIIGPLMWLAGYRHPPPPPDPEQPNQRLDVQALRSLPRVLYDAECPICLMEFADEDLIRVLPHCGHGFHVKCVNRWLKCQSSCPSCRRGVLVMEEKRNK